MKKKILVAEDDTSDQYIYQLGFDAIDCAKDYDIEFVNDGAELMKRVKSDGPLPDLIFLDINMPYFSGIECLLYMRLFSTAETLPVVVYSTSDAKADVDKTYRLGANLYMVKPTSFEAVVEMLQLGICREPWGDVQPPREKFFIDRRGTPDLVVNVGAVGAGNPLFR